MSASAPIACALCLILSTPSRGDVSWNLGAATLALDEKFGAVLNGVDEKAAWPAPQGPAFTLETDSGQVVPESCRQDGDRLILRFADGTAAEFTVQREPGVALFRLTKFAARSAVRRFNVFRLTVPATAKLGSAFNAAYVGDRVVAVLPAKPNVLVYHAPRTLGAATLEKHKLEPAAFGVLACRRSELSATIERFENAAGMAVPRPGGVWNKRSPEVKHSYLFLTDFRESDFDAALALARRGGFHCILLEERSWAAASGHYEVNRERFRDGLAGLKRTVERFRGAGIKVGLHLLAASITPPDRYITPVPDPRLVTDATTTLAADVDATADVLPVTALPREFPAEDGGYEGKGTVLRVGDELIAYGERATREPYEFLRCRRGYLGTKAVAHREGDRITHLTRSYNYFLLDMDTTLLDEAAANFARVANACRIDMVYFDGSEHLQGDHWYYNARLIEAFLDRLENRAVLAQASTFSSYSWHLLARSASADGHGDLKGYLDERSPGIVIFGRDGMPTDIGWYFGYDPNSTLDQFEYVLGATIGYDTSMSYQVSTAAAHQHPFGVSILEQIARYEQLRLSGRVPNDMRARLRIDPALGGKMPADKREALLGRRREYRLLGPEGHEVFQRVIYSPWHEMGSSSRSAATGSLEVKEGPVRVGFWVHALPSPRHNAGRSYRSARALTLESFDDLAPYTQGARSRNVRRIAAGQGGAAAPGVTQQVEIHQGGAREGKRYATFTATTKPTASGGWSTISRQFNPPLDLSWHKGLGLWFRGDGRGGRFKIQLRDATDAVDYYISNDFAEWRYLQLVRPAKDAIDYANVRSLAFFYNELPGATTVSCAIDGLKALRSLDQPSIKDPWVEIGGRRLAWKGTLSAGEYLVAWPGEPVLRHTPAKGEPERVAKQAETLTLPDGNYAVKFGSDEGSSVTMRVRVTLQPPERYELSPH